MDKKRKIKCDCGGNFFEKEIEIDEILTKAMVCNKCGYQTLTVEQARAFLELKETHRAIDTEKKIIRIGNSRGITLPERVDMKIGEFVKTQVINPHAFMIISKKKLIS